jgi:peptidyl-prolyl cis-trans isomerase A (cyclophilin A)
MKKAIVGAATLATFRQSPAPVLAEDIIESPGRVVKLEIANLDGVEGNIGIVKIKLQSEWAPVGVKRFEVRLKLGKPLHTYINCELFLISSLFSL